MLLTQDLGSGMLLTASEVISFPPFLRWQHRFLHPGDSRARACPSEASARGQRGCSLRLSTGCGEPSPRAAGGTGSPGSPPPVSPVSSTGRSGHTSRWSHFFPRLQSPLRSPPGPSSSFAQTL